MKNSSWHWVVRALDCASPYKAKTSSFEQSMPNTRSEAPRCYLSSPEQGTLPMLWWPNAKHNHVSKVKHQFYNTLYDGLADRPVSDFVLNFWNVNRSGWICFTHCSYSEYFFWLTLHVRSYSKASASSVASRVIMWKWSMYKLNLPFIQYQLTG